MWKKTLSVARWLLPHVRRAAPVTLVLGLLALIVATWWLGPRWPLGGDYPLASWQMRALVTLVAVLTLVILWSGGLAVRLRKVNQARAEQQRE